MKAIHKIKWVYLVLLLTIAGMTLAQPGVRISRYDFYDELAPYGQWMDYPSYGQVWRPRVEVGFQPYATGGHWEMTEYGNTWMSDYEWGWAPFHYGRWLFDDYYGWIWVPDDEWGPAWVTWRSGGGYYGWAPLGPGMGIDININLHIPYNYWVFVPDIYIRSPRVYSYCVPRPRVVNVYNSTTIINNYYRYNNRSYVYGPQRYDIERATRSRVNVYRADDLYRQGRSYARNNDRDYRQEPNRNYGPSRPTYDTPARRDNQSYSGNNNNRVYRDNTPPARSQEGQNDRSYQSAPRGNAQRTWSDDSYSQPRNGRDSREATPQRTYENAPAPSRRGGGGDNGAPTRSYEPSRDTRDYSRARGQQESSPRSSERQGGGGEREGGGERVGGGAGRRGGGN